jgi:DNA-binding CsgD family transcriptional regulator
MNLTTTAEPQPAPIRTPFVPAPPLRLQSRRWTDRVPAAAVPWRLLDALPTPVVIVGREREVLHRNAAGACAGALDCLTLAHGRICAFAGTASDRLEAVLLRAQWGDPSDVVITVWTTQRPALWRVRVAPFADREAGTPSNPAALLMIDPPPDGARLTGVLERLFDLTPSERRVLGLLLADRSPREIAGELQIAVTTVRTHLQSLFAKTGTRRQSELVALAWSAA